MPYTEAEQAIVDAVAGIDDQNQRADFAPSGREKIRKWEIVALVLNRTIGSGIFLTPHRVLAGVGSVGGALLLWAAGALISTCGLLVWLECGLSIPQRRVRGEDEPRGVPRSGGEKNYLEYMFSGKLYRTTCMFGIMFILLGNLSGNAVSFGTQVLIAAGKYDPFTTTDLADKYTVMGIAIASVTAAVVLHLCSRRGGIVVSNVFAAMKVLLLIVIICLGFAKAAGCFGGNAPLNNFTKGVFHTRRKDVASYSDSLLYIMYTFSGFEQPFYVLAETKSPRKVFPKYTLLAMAIAASLFMLTNISYLLAVRVDRVIPEQGPLPNIDLATLFFESLFSKKEQARRAMAALIAFAIFGNIVVMTFTAARVKQEIAKEGILYKSLFFANSHTTPYGWIKQKVGLIDRNDPEARLEQSPMAALLLHWVTSMILIFATLPIKDVRVTYSVLVSLYSYSILILLGCWVCVGLLMLKFRKGKFHWQDRRRYRPFISPMHAIIYGSACAFVLVASFAPPSPGSPYHPSITKIPWYLVPAIGISSPLWGLSWYYGLVLVQWIRKRDLVVDRTAYWKKDLDNPEEYIQRAEIITHDWQPRRHEWGSDEESTQGSGMDRVKGPNDAARGFGLSRITARRVGRNGRGGDDDDSEMDQPHPMNSSSGRHPSSWVSLSRS